MIFNPLPWKRKALVQFDMFCDPNNPGRDFDSLQTQNGLRIPIHWSITETNYGPCKARWKRLNAVVELPPSGYQVYSFEQNHVESPGDESDILEKLNALISRISFEILEDKFDTWGHGANGLGKTIDRAVLTQSEVIDRGVVFCRLRADYTYGDSIIQLKLIKYRGIDPVVVDLQVDWREKRRTLKLTLATGIHNAAIVSGVPSKNSIEFKMSGVLLLS